MELQETSWMRLEKLVFKERGRTEAIIENKMEELHSSILSEVELKLSSFKRMVIEQERRAGPEFSSLGHISWAMSLDDQAKLRRWQREEEELRWMRMQQMRPAQKQAWSPQSRVEVKPSDTEARLREEMAAREQQELKARMKALEDNLKLMEDFRRDMKDLMAKTKEKERWEVEREKALEEERKRVEREKQEKEKEESRKEMEREAKIQEKKLEEMKQCEIELKQKEEEARKSLLKEMADLDRREIEAERLLMEAEKKRLEREKRVLKQRVDHLQRNEGKMAWEHETERKRLEREMRDLKQKVEDLQATNEAREEYEARKEKQNFERAKRGQTEMKMQREKNKERKKTKDEVTQHNCVKAEDSDDNCSEDSGTDASDDSYSEDSSTEGGKEQRPEVTTVSATAINTAVVRKPKKTTLRQKPEDVSRVQLVKNTGQKQSAQEEDEDNSDDSHEEQPSPRPSGTKTAVAHKAEMLTSPQQKPADVSHVPPVKSTAKKAKKRAPAKEKSDKDSSDGSDEEQPSPCGTKTAVTQKVEMVTTPLQKPVNVSRVPVEGSAAKKECATSQEEDESSPWDSDDEAHPIRNGTKTTMAPNPQTTSKSEDEPRVPPVNTAGKKQSVIAQEEDESSPWDSDEAQPIRSGTKTATPPNPSKKQSVIAHPSGSKTPITSQSKPVGAPHIQKAPVPVQQHANVSSGPMKGNTGAIEKPVKALTDKELFELELRQFEKELRGNSSNKKTVVASNTQKAAVPAKNTFVSSVPMKQTASVKKPVKALTDDDLFDLELERLDKELNSSSSNKKPSMATSTQKASMVGMNGNHRVTSSTTNNKSWGDTQKASTSMKQGSVHSMLVEKNTYGKAPASDIFDPWSDEEDHSLAKTQTQRKTTALSHMDKVDTFAMERELERLMNDQSTTAPKKWGHQDVKKPQALLKNTVPTNLDEVDTFAIERELERLNNEGSKQNEKEAFERRANELLERRRSTSGSSLTGVHASSSFTSAGSSLTGMNASSSFTGARAGSSLTSVRTGSSLGGTPGQSNTNLGLKQPAYTKYLNRDR
ncbi:trichohyalin-like [Engraulis encrasicolus]|uniref:trichohyalin-like n=1 Tax=Engraulis encrasicolus TaxID=184585 RepID=UPI002FD20BA9